MPWAQQQRLKERIHSIEWEMRIHWLMQRWRSVAWREAKRLAATRRNKIARLALLEQIQNLQEEIVSLHKKSPRLSSTLEDFAECVCSCPRVTAFVSDKLLRILQHGLKRCQAKTQTDEKRTQSDKKSKQNDQHHHSLNHIL